MILLRKMFASSNKTKKQMTEEEKKRADDIIKGGSAIMAGVGGGALGSYLTMSGYEKTNKDRLTGKVTRYHNTAEENVNKILEEGLKTKYAEDPNNLTNVSVIDVDMDKKKGKIYLAKNAEDAEGIGKSREIKLHKPGKTLKVELDYDEDVKGKPRIANPELSGAKSPKEFYDNVLIKRAKQIHPEFSFDNNTYDNLNPSMKADVDDIYRTLGEDTHIVDKDIDPSKIVGGKGYKKRGIKKILKYALHNPRRFGKEAVKMAPGVALTGASLGLAGYGVKKLADGMRKEEK